jgi:hypothetical protein
MTRIFGEVVRLKFGPAGSRENLGKPGSRRSFSHSTTAAVLRTDKASIVLSNA